MMIITDKTEEKEFDNLMEEVKRRTKSLQYALEPLLGQIILIDIRRQNLPYGLSDNAERIKEMNACEEYLKGLIDQVLGFTQRK